MKSQIFDENDGLTPLEKCQFFCFHSREWLVFYIKRQKSFFYDVFPRSIKWGYGRVTRGYKGFQGIRTGYRKTFFELERPQILFIDLFCIKIKVDEISNF